MSNNTGSKETNSVESSTGESPTTFGKSVESQAQYRDANAIGQQSTDTPLNVYRLVPTAEPDDPRWDNSPGYGEVVVAARTSGDARIVASSRELDFMEIDAAPAEGNSTNGASPFRNEKLYTVIEIDSNRTDLKRGVLEGTIGVDNLTPTQK